MKIRVRLSDADRQRFECDEWLEFDWTLTFAEAIPLQDGVSVGGAMVGFDTPSDWRMALVGRPVIGPDGEPAMRDVIDDEGNPVLDDAGQPVRVIKRKTDFGAALVAAWVALRRAGKDVSLVDVSTCDLGMRLDFVPDPDETESGKDQSAPETTS